MMKQPNNTKYLLFGGTFVLANKLQYVGDSLVEGLSTKQWFLLRNIMDLPSDPPPTISQIATGMDTSRQNVTQMLEIMEREGLVRIEKSLSDRRSRCVCITEEGMLSTRQTTENAQSFLYELFDGISETERKEAGKVLTKMIQNLENMKATINQ